MPRLLGATRVEGRSFGSMQGHQVRWSCRWGGQIASERGYVTWLLSFAIRGPLQREIGGCDADGGGAGDAGGGRRRGVAAALRIFVFILSAV